jgi:5-methylcytosine-specific restriction endonuclease McrA
MPRDYRKPLLGVGVSARNNKYLAYRLSAERRGHTFSLTKDEFNILVDRDCEYCGCPPATVWRKENSKFLCNGIDRVDNSVGYEFHNCVPCCTVCNRAKSTMTKKEFLSWVGRVFRHGTEKAKGDS